MTLAVLSGCAVNQFGWVEVRHFEAATVRRVELETTGIFISTQDVDAGITLGATERHYFYPKKAEHQHALSIQQIMQSTTFTETDDIQEAVGGDSEAFAWYVANKGLTLNINAQHSGLSLGRINRYRLRQINNNQIIIIKRGSDQEYQAYYQSIPD